MYLDSLHSTIHVQSRRILFASRWPLPSPYLVRANQTATKPAGTKYHRWYNEQNHYWLESISHRFSSEQSRIRTPKKLPSLPSPRLSMASHPSDSDANKQHARPITRNSRKHSVPHTGSWQSKKRNRLKTRDSWNEIPISRRQIGSWISISHLHERTGAFRTESEHAYEFYQVGEKQLERDEIRIFPSSAILLLYTLFKSSKSYQHPFPIMLDAFETLNKPPVIFSWWSSIS